MLEREFKPNYSPLPLIVYDFQVIAHDLYKWVDTYLYAAEQHEDSALIFVQLIKCAWCYKLNYGIDTLETPLKAFTAIVVNDLKGEVDISCSESGIGYWRHIVAHELELKEYKQGRSANPEMFNIVCQIGLSYIQAPNSTFYYYAQKYMEADDLAGKLARIKRNSNPNTVASQRNMFLYTVDGDWQGLVSDKHKIVWCNVGPWFPRMRDDAGVADYYFRKLGATITESRQCYELKAIHGDLGDGLYPGTPLRLFDLYNEDHEYNFSEQTTNYLENVLNSTKNSKKIEHLQTSSKFFAKHGIIPPVLGSPIPEIYEYEEKKLESERKSAHLKGTSLTIKKICKEMSDFSTECVQLGKQDELLRLQIKTLEDRLFEATLYETKFIKSAIKDLKKSREKLKNEAKKLLTDLNI